MRLGRGEMKAADAHAIEMKPLTKRTEVATSGGGALRRAHSAVDIVLLSLVTLACHVAAMALIVFMLRSPMSASPARNIAMEICSIAFSCAGFTLSAFWLCLSRSSPCSPQQQSLQAQLDEAACCFVVYSKRRPNRLLMVLLSGGLWMGVVWIHLKCTLGSMPGADELTRGIILLYCIALFAAAAYTVLAVLMAAACVWRKAECSVWRAICIPCTIFGAVKRRPKHATAIFCLLTLLVLLIVPVIIAWMRGPSGNYQLYQGILGGYCDVCHDIAHSKDSAPPLLWMGLLPRRTFNFFMGSEKCPNSPPDGGNEFSFYDFHERILYVAATCPGSPAPNAEDYSDELARKLFLRTAERGLALPTVVVLDRPRNSLSDLQTSVSSPAMFDELRRAAEQWNRPDALKQILNPNVPKTSLRVPQLEPSQNTSSPIDDAEIPPSTAHAEFKLSTAKLFVKQGVGSETELIQEKRKDLAAARLVRFLKASSVPVFYTLPLPSATTSVRCGAKEEFHLWKVPADAQQAEKPAKSESTTEEQKAETTTKLAASQGAEAPPETTMGSPSATTQAAEAPAGDSNKTANQDFTPNVNATRTAGELSVRQLLEATPAKASIQPLSVLAIHIDSESRAAFIRDLPQTTAWLRQRPLRLVSSDPTTIRAQLTQNESTALKSSKGAVWAEFLGMTTIGHGTSSNMAAALTGWPCRCANASSAPALAQNNIFALAKKKYGKRAHTALLADCCRDIAEKLLGMDQDAASIGFGSQRGPIDNDYFAGYCDAESHGPAESIFHGTQSIRRRCIGRKYVHEHALDYVRYLQDEFEAVQRQEQDAVFFHFAHLSDADGASHAVASLMDSALVEFLSDLDDIGFFSKHALLLLSGNGADSGPYFVATEGGKAERATPFAILSAPQSAFSFNFESQLACGHEWSQRYGCQAQPFDAAGLSANQLRLSTPYDLYHTLRDLMQLYDEGEAELSQVTLPSQCGSEALFSQGSALDKSRTSLWSSTFPPLRGSSLLRQLRTASSRVDCCSAHAEAQCLLAFCSK